MDPALDPFPLFHLSDLAFEVASSTVNKLSASQLALAPFSADCEQQQPLPLAVPPLVLTPLCLSCRG